MRDNFVEVVLSKIKNEQALTQEEFNILITEYSVKNFDIQCSNYSRKIFILKLNKNIFKLISKIPDNINDKNSLNISLKVSNFNMPEEIVENSQIKYFKRYNNLSSTILDDESVADIYDDFLKKFKSDLFWCNAFYNNSNKEIIVDTIAGIIDNSLIRKLTKSIKFNDFSFFQDHIVSISNNDSYVDSLILNYRTLGKTFKVNFSLFNSKDKLNESLIKIKIEEFQLINSIFQNLF